MPVFVGFCNFGRRSRTLGDKIPRCELINSVRDSIKGWKNAILEVILKCFVGSFGVIRSKFGKVLHKLANHIQPTRLISL